MVILVERNANLVVIVPMVGSGGVCICWEFGVLNLALSFVLRRSAGMSAVIVFTFNFVCGSYINFVHLMRFTRTVLQ